MVAHVFPTGFFGLPLGEDLNSLANNGTVAITAGTINGTTIGASSASSVRATTLNASGATNVAALTATGATSLAALTASGATSIAALTASGAVVLSNASVTISNLGTADPHVAGQLWMNSRVLTVSAG